MRHLTVYRENGCFAGWPANFGIWAWADEILVGFAEAPHKPTEGHTYDRENARAKFARSLDGGERWTIEDAYENGIVGEGQDHVLGDLARTPKPLADGVDFMARDFASMFMRAANDHGPSDFYYSLDRGKRWHGPYAMPDMDTTGLVTRTSYIIEGPRVMLAFLTAAKSDVSEGRVLCARTEDGGVTWRRVAWIGPELEPPRHFMIMPAAVRLSERRLVAAIRRREGGRFGLQIYVSDDNARTWRPIETPALGNLPRQTGDPVHNPPSLIRLHDGRLCLTYAVRVEPARVCVRFSEDEGHTWSDEWLVRGKEGSGRDMGYTRMVQRPDGQVVVVYYFNHAMREDPSYRYIAATIFGPVAHD